MLWRGFVIFETSQSFDQITTLTYVLIDNFLFLFLQDFSDQNRGLINLLNRPCLLYSRGSPLRPNLKILTTFKLQHVIFMIKG